MAAYLSLTEKATGKVYAGANLIELDTRIAQEVFGIEADPKRWTYLWMDFVGFDLAMKDTETLFTYADWPEMHHIAKWLNDNFENTSYYAR